MINLTGYKMINTVIDEDDRLFLLSIGVNNCVSHTTYRDEVLKMALRYRNWFHYFMPKQRVLIYKDRALARKLAKHGFKPVIWTF
jgi:hypothetical protein